MPVGNLEAGMAYSLPQRMLITVLADGWSSINTWFLGTGEITRAER